MRCRNCLAQVDGKVCPKCGTVLSEYTEKNNDTVDEMEEAFWQSIREEDEHEAAWKELQEQKKILQKEEKTQKEEASGDILNQTKSEKSFAKEAWPMDFLAQDADEVLQDDTDDDELFEDVAEEVKHASTDQSRAIRFRKKVQKKKAKKALRKDLADTKLETPDEEKTAPVVKNEQEQQIQKRFFITLWGICAAIILIALVFLIVRPVHFWNMVQRKSFYISESGELMQSVGKTDTKICDHAGRILVASTDGKQVWYLDQEAVLYYYSESTGPLLVSEDAGESLWTDPLATQCVFVTSSIISSDEDMEDKAGYNAFYWNPEMESPKQLEFSVSYVSNFHFDQNGEKLAYSVQSMGASHMIRCYEPKKDIVSVAATGNEKVLCCGVRTNGQVLYYSYENGSVYLTEEASEPNMVLSDVKAAWADDQVQAVVFLQNAGTEESNACILSDGGLQSAVITAKNQSGKNVSVFDTLSVYLSDAGKSVLLLGVEADHAYYITILDNARKKTAYYVGSDLSWEDTKAANDGSLYRCEDGVLYLHDADEGGSTRLIENVSEWKIDEEDVYVKTSGKTVYSAKIGAKQMIRCADQTIGF